MLLAILFVLLLLAIFGAFKVTAGWILVGLLLCAIVVVYHRSGPTPRV